MDEETHHLTEEQLKDTTTAVSKHAQDTSSNMKEQRDRFLAFAFASADLFIEVGENGGIHFILGATKIITGCTEKELIGKNWLDLFTDKDRPSLRAMRKQAKPAQRCGPLLVTLKSDIASSDGQMAILTGISMPDQDKFYVTLGFTSVFMAKTGAAIREAYEQKALDKDTFIEAAQEAMKMARDLGQKVDMTLLDINLTQDVIERFGENKVEELRSDIVNSLLRKSLDGFTAAEIKEGRYSIVHDKSISSESLTEEIQELTKKADPKKKGLEVADKTIEADLELLTERDTTKALVYTLNEFERKGTELSINNLNTSFKAYLAANTHRINVFKTLISQLNFKLHFQPIVDLHSYDAHHYEMLARFPNGESPYEWVVFGEDVGLATDFDMAVCERALNYFRYKSQSSQMKFAINLSGQSIQNEAFFQEMIKKLQDSPEAKNRLMFEITESSNIEELEAVGQRVNILQDMGYDVCLDDFGAGSASFQYLNNLHVKYVKIDGQYIHAIENSQRERSLIKNLINLCSELKIKTVGEMVENETQLNLLSNMGCDYGQGYLFAKPGPKPDYEPPKDLLK